MADDVHAVARLAFLVAAVAALGSLFSYELLRAIADRLAPAGNAANLDRTLHAAIVVYLRAIAVSAAIAAGSLLVGGQAVASRLATPWSRRALDSCLDGRLRHRAAGRTVVVSRLRGVG